MAEMGHKHRISVLLGPPYVGSDSNTYRNLCSAAKVIECHKPTVNPANAQSAEATQREITEAARAIGLQIQFLHASASREIESAFATLVRERADALFVAGDPYFVSRRVQFATLAAKHGIPASYPTSTAERKLRLRLA
jgi:ABC-type uncharacterized transport system substrate-binding protein